MINFYKKKQRKINIAILAFTTNQQWDKDIIIIYIYIFEYIPLTFYKADFLISEMRYRLLWT